MKKKKSTLLIVGMSFLLSIGTLMFSSCADKDDPSPILPTPEDTSYILKLKFSEKVEFKEILNKNDIQDLTETETIYAWKRLLYLPTRPYAQPVSGLYQPRRFPYRRHTLGKPLPLVARREKTRIKPYLHLSHRKGKAIRQRAESYTKTTIGSAIFHTRGMATRPTLAQETVSENRRFPSKKQTNKESGQQCL